MTNNSSSTSTNTSELPSYSLFDFGNIDDVTINQIIGDDNGHDIYAFSVTETGEFNLSLEGLSADADLLLLDEQLNEVAISQAYETESELITAELAPGEYYATVYSHDGVETDYTLDIDNNAIAEDVPDSEQIDTSKNEVLYGDYEDNTLDGGLGNDTLYGGGGSDRLLGGAGNDFIDGSSTEFETEVDYSFVDDETGETYYFDIFPDYWLDSTYYPDEVDTLTGGEGSDTFALGDNFGSYYEDRSYSYLANGFGGSIYDYCQALACDEIHYHEGQTNDYAIITDFNGQEGDLFQIYGNQEEYTLSTENFMGEELADTLIHYGSDLIAVVSDNTDISLERDFSALGNSPDFEGYLTDSFVA